EVLVLQLLALGRAGAEQRATRVDQVRAREEEVLVDQEVLLLRANGREDLLGVLVAEQAQDAQRLVRQRFHRAEQGGLLVQGLAGPAEEDGRDNERGPVRPFVDERGAGGVPGSVAAGLEGGADAAGGERAGVRL